MQRHRLVALLVAVALGTGACGNPPRPESGRSTPTTSSNPSTSTATPPPAGGPVYFLHTGTVSQPGPVLQPVWRTGASTPAGALAALLDGPPGAGDPYASPALSTAVPSSTVVRTVSTTGHIAVVDLDRSFETGGGSTAMFARLAQVVYTLTAFPDIFTVTLLIDGKATPVFSSEGIEIGDRVDREFFRGTGVVPDVLIDRPAWGEPVGHRFAVSGIAKGTRDGMLRWEMNAGNETRVASGDIPLGTSAWGYFRTEIASAATATGRRTLTVTPTTGAGTPIAVPFVVEDRAGDACSASPLPRRVDWEPGLPAVVAEMRTAMAAAAAACDVEELARLGDRHGAGLRLTYVGESPPVATLLRDLEAEGQMTPLWYLRRILDIPGAYFTATAKGGGPFFGWPSSFRPGGATPEDLRTVDDAGIATIDQQRDMIREIGGYAGWRVLVTDTGDWQLFVTGE